MPLRPAAPPPMLEQCAHHGRPRSHQNIPRSGVPAQLLPRGHFARHVESHGQPLCGRTRNAQRRAPAQPLHAFAEPDRCRPGAARPQHRAGGHGREHAQRPAGPRLAPAGAASYERAARADRGLAVRRDRRVHPALPRRVREPGVHQRRPRPDRGRHRHPPDGRAHRRHEPDRAPAGAFRHGGLREPGLLGAARHSHGARRPGSPRRAELFGQAHHPPALRDRRQGGRGAGAQPHGGQRRRCAHRAGAARRGRGLRARAAGAVAPGARRAGAGAARAHAERPLAVCRLLAAPPQQRRDAHHARLPGAVDGPARQSARDAAAAARAAGAGLSSSSSVATAATCALSRVPGAARATASAGRTDRPPRR